MPWPNFPETAIGATTACSLSQCRIPMVARRGLKRLVDACHQHGLAVVLDVVYNHVGPEGNYLPQFSISRICTRRLGVKP